MSPRTSAPPQARADPAAPPPAPIRLLTAGVLLGACASILAAAIAYVHRQLADSSVGYTSFCNVNATVNCDRVLTSPFATLFGVPVAWCALATYAIIAVTFGMSLFGPLGRRRTALRLACLAVYGAVVFSAYMAFLSLVVLETVCLMCTGLYLLTLALLWVAWTAPTRFDSANELQDATLPVIVRAAAVIVCTGVVGALAPTAWPSAAAGAAASVSVADIRAQKPQFYEWYTSLPEVTPPVVDRHAIGDADAPVTIVEFFDFECGHCASNHQQLKDLLARRRGEVRLIYRHFPLDPSCNDAVPVQVHMRACLAAEAAECAAVQGRFEDMVDAMFLRRTQLFEDNLPRIAERLGIDGNEFRACLDERRMLPLVLEDTRAGARLGITSTPTMFINGREVAGAIEEPGGYDYAVTIERDLASSHARSAN